MKTKVLSVLFTASFLITGCGIEAIFNGGFKEWCFCFMFTAVCGFVLFGGKK